MTPSPPIILGSSLTGLLLSYGLSKRGIQHTLVGGAPPGLMPRLGESMSELSSVDLWHWMDPEFRRFLYPKSHISLFHADTVSMIRVGSPRRRIADIKLGYGERPRLVPLLSSLVHVDRLGFDALLYQRVLQSPRCEFIHCPRSRVVFQGSSDRVRAVELGQHGRIVDPCFVFDATGPRSIVAQAAGAQARPLSQLQRVIWTHLSREPGGSCEAWWQHGTNLLRLDRGRDGVHGMSWLIPLGDTLSIGLSVLSPYEDTEALFKLLLAAYARRGLDLAATHPKVAPLRTLEHRYSQRSRAFGANWMLAAGAYLQAWFPSSAGVATAMAAAHIAPFMLQEPQRYGPIYQRTLSGYLPFHEHIAQMIQTPGLSPSAARRYWSKWLAYVPGRLAQHLRLHSGEPESRALRYRALERYGEWSGRHTVAHSLSAGLVQIRVGAPPQLSQQGQAFGGYFSPGRALVKGCVAGWVGELGAALSPENT